MSAFAEYLPGRRSQRDAADIFIRTAVTEDISAILGVEREADRTGLTAALLRAAIDDVGRQVLVAVSAGHVVGWGKTHYWDHGDGEAPAGHYLGGVTVAPEWRRRGVAAALTGERLDWIWERSPEAWYIVNVRNLASIDLHGRWGFEEASRAPRFHTTSFTGGVGLLMRASRPVS